MVNKKISDKELIDLILASMGAILSTYKVKMKQASRVVKTFNLRFAILPKGCYGKKTK